MKLLFILEPWPTFILEIGALLRIPKCEDLLMKWEMATEGW